MFRFYHQYRQEALLKGPEYMPGVILRIVGVPKLVAADLRRLLNKPNAIAGLDNLGHV
jgi:hypothetical protein